MEKQNNNPQEQVPAPMDAKDGVKKIEISLPEDLRYWRAERPDEWIMDQFIRKADTLISEASSLRESVASLTAERDALRDALGSIAAIECPWNSGISDARKIARAALTPKTNEKPR